MESKLLKCDSCDGTGLVDGGNFCCADCEGRGTQASSLDKATKSLETLDRVAEQDA